MGRDRASYEVGLLFSEMLDTSFDFSTDWEVSPPWWQVTYVIALRKITSERADSK
jgi:hypothetical protein